MTATESDYMQTILEAARIGGWKTAHFRPARTAHGWRTPVAGDGKGFPDLVLVHAVRRHVMFVEVKGHKGRITPEQAAWYDALRLAGADARVVFVPHELDEFCTELVARRAA